jgi:tetratricopeptide (TPR) repeat protein
MKYVAWILSALVFLAATAAHADERPVAAPASAEAAAREYYRIGNAHFDAGRYLEAQAAFAAGYEMSQRPGFLWNMAECARLLKDDARALELYRRYVSAAPHDAPQRADAEKRVEELAPKPALAPAPPKPATPATTAAPEKNVFFAPPPKPVEDTHRPITTRWWFWTAAAGVVAATAVTVALVASHSGSSSAPPPSGALSVNWK